MPTGRADPPRSAGRRRLPRRPASPARVAAAARRRGQQRPARGTPAGWDERAGSGTDSVRGRCAGLEHRTTGNAGFFHERFFHSRIAANTRTGSETRVPRYLLTESTTAGSVQRRKGIGRLLLAHRARHGRLAGRAQFAVAALARGERGVARLYAFAKPMFASVYSWPQYTLVSSGSARSFSSDAYICSAPFPRIRARSRRRTACRRRKARLPHNRQYARAYGPGCRATENETPSSGNAHLVALGHRRGKRRDRLVLRPVTGTRELLAAAQCRRRDRDGDASRGSRRGQVLAREVIEHRPRLARDRPPRRASRCAASKRSCP